MIGRLGEAGDSDSSEPHLSVVKATSNSTVCQIIHNNVQKATTEVADLKDTQLTVPSAIAHCTEKEDGLKLDCTLAVSLSQASNQYGASSKKTDSETSNDYVKCASVSETSVGDMTTSATGFCTSHDNEKTIKCQLVNCSEQECDPYELHIYNDLKDDNVNNPAVAITSARILSMPDVNPIGSVKVISCEVVNCSENESFNSMNAIREFQKLPSNATSVEYQLNSKSLADADYQMIASNKSQTLQVQELNSVAVSDLFKRSCDDVNISYVKNSKPNVSVVKCSSSKSNSYVKYAPNILNKQIPVQNRSTSSLSATNTVLNTSHTVQKLRTNPQVYKLQNVVVKASNQNANGYVTQYAQSLNTTTSQTVSDTSLNAVSRGSSGESNVSKSHIPDFIANKQLALEREPVHLKKNRKVLLSNQNSGKDSSIDHFEQYQSQTNYSSKLPNIISKVRDNLSENSLKTKHNRLLLNSSDKFSEHTRVVRKYEPKFSTNTVNMEHTKLLKKNRPDIFTLNRHSVKVSDKISDTNNTFAESVSLDHNLGSPSTSILLNQETYSRRNQKQAIRTGQNNNIDVLSNNWKQASSVGSHVISENVTPISTSNTWDDIPKLNYRVIQESVSPSVESTVSTQQSPQILIVRGDSQAPQRSVCDEEFIKEEIRPKRTDHLPPAYHSLQIVLQDHNYGAPPPTSIVSPMSEIFSNNGNNIEHISNFNSKNLRQHEDEDAASVVSIESHNHLNNEEDEETETAPEEENETSDVMDDKNSITRCICDFQHDDGYMIQCGQCLVWQHIVCVGVTPKRIPKKYLCDFCQPRELDRYRAHSLQKMIRDDLNMLTSSDSSPTRSSDKDRVNLKNITKRRGESSVNFPVTYNTTRNKRIRRDSSPKVKVRRPYKERKKVFRKKIKTDMDRPSVRPWLENYELAITNHYSQELRARLSGITKKQEERPNFVLTDCTTIPFAGGRIMISTIDIPSNTPVIELMGKFMLSSQHQNATALLVGTNSRQVTQKPGPFVFFYRMPQEGTDVCIDTRTYGNEARFVRRSCKPNCELHHWFDKGTLHIFLMSIEKIESNTEITLRHELGWHGLGIGRTPSNPCACNSPECLLLNPIQNRKSYTSSDAPSKLRVNKTRAMTSRSYMVKDKPDSPKSEEDPMPDDDLDEDIPNMPSKINDEDIQSDFRTSPIKSSQDSDNTSDDLRKIMASCPDLKTLESPRSSFTAEDRLGKASSSNEPVPSTSRRTRRVYTRRNRANKKLMLQDSSPQEPKPSGESADESYNDLHIKDMKKMTREERKIAQVMKVFDRLEKDKAKRSSGAPRGRRQDSESDHARRDESTDVEHSSANIRVHRSRGKGRRKTQISRDYKQKTRRSVSEGGSDEHLSAKKSALSRPSTSEASKIIGHGIELNLENKPVSANKTESEEQTALSKRGLRRRKIIFPKKQQISIEEPQQGQQTEEAAGLLLALARSTPANPTDPSPSNGIIDSPISNMISVCQLVEAAVGPLETSLKSPKKAILNEWMNKSPESPLAYELPETTAATYNECSSNSNSPLTLFCLGNESVQNRSIPSSKLLDTLVQAASSICDIGTEYSDCNPTNNNAKENIKDSQVSESAKSIQHTEFEEKQKLIEKVLENESNILLDSTVIDKTSSLPIDNESVKNDIKSLIYVNHINEEKFSASSDILNVASQKLKTYASNDGSCVKQILFPDSEESILEPTTYIDAYESTNLNSTDNLCNPEVNSKNAAVDVTTELSNDSNNVYSGYQGNNGGSAKKRWLHQALSEESDHPLSKASTPLKKRRLVRESTSEIVHLSNDDVNEFTVDTKNFQSATTVATSSDTVNQKSLQNKNTVVADMNTNKNNSFQNIKEKKTFINDLVNNKTITGPTQNSENAFDWENLECHDETNASLQVNSVIATISSTSLNSLTDNIRSEIVDTSHSKHQIPDEIEDIHKRLQSFHSENIQVLRSRNQKPKTQVIESSQRKKVNLMFEVSILENQTVAVELCNEAKASAISNKLNSSQPSTPNKDLDTSNSTQIISYDFEEFSRHESNVMHHDDEVANINRERDLCTLDNELSTSSLPNYTTLTATESNISEVKNMQSQDDICVNSTKYSTEKNTSLLSFNDIPSKIDSCLQNSLSSPTNVFNKHEIGVAARARLDSILNATDISQDAMFDQVLKKNIPNHVANVVRNESPLNSPIPCIPTGYVKPVARTSSSDPRLQQSAPIKKKLSLTEYRARKKTDTNGNGNDVYSNEKSVSQLNILIADDEEPNDQENFMFTPEPTLVERELEKHPGFLSRDFFTVPSSITNDLANESETEESTSVP